MITLTIDKLREQVRGDVITADDERYDEARKVRNGMIDKRPQVIVRPANAGDVMSAVNFAREGGLDLAIRGGAHSVPAGSECGLPDRDLQPADPVAGGPHDGPGRAEGGVRRACDRLRSSRLNHARCYEERARATGPFLISTLASSTS